ncbi:hypothetical protein ACSN7O_004820 [Enterobacter chuandaensis]
MKNTSAPFPLLILMLAGLLALAVAPAGRAGDASRGEANAKFRVRTHGEWSVEKIKDGTAWASDEDYTNYSRLAQVRVNNKTVSKGGFYLKGTGASGFRGDYAAGIYAVNQDASGVKVDMKPILMDDDGLGGHIFALMGQGQPHAGGYRSPVGLGAGKSAVVAFRPSEPPGTAYVSGRYVITVELIAAEG